MMFRRKLLGVFALTVFLSVAAVAWLVSEVTRRAFVRSEDERTAALVTQFRREFNQQGEDVARRVETIAASEAASRMALALNRAPADSGPYFESAKTIAENSQLDFLEFVESDGTIVSSAQSPAKFGYPEGAAGSFSGAADQEAFLKQEELQDGTALGLFAVRATLVGERPVYVMGGRRLDKESLGAGLAGWHAGAAVSESRGSVFGGVTDRSFRIFFHFYIFFRQIARPGKAGTADRCGGAIWAGNDGSCGVVGGSGGG
jgi:hypothetical protein